MRIKTFFITGAVAVLGSFASTRGDWDPTDPAKFVQLPDLSPLGLDVLASQPKILADDFLCRQRGPISDVHIWGSWLNDHLPQPAAGGPGDPNGVLFKLSIHEDIPATPNSPSRPGALRWSRIFEPAEFTARRVATGQEQFYDPNVNQIVGVDTVVWQYNFTNILDPFIQEGEPNAPKIYWLDVQAKPLDEVARFGWKTSVQHFNDDAVFGDTPFGGESTFWKDMHYPDGHPLFPQSIDLAFVITPEPASLAWMALGSLLLMRRRK